MTDEIEKRLAKLERELAWLGSMLTLPEEYQEWAGGVGVFELVSDDIEKAKHRANKAYNLAEESGIMAIKFKEELMRYIESCVNDIEERLDELEGDNDKTS